MERTDYRVKDAKGKEAFVKWALLICALFGVLALFSIAVFLFATGTPFIFKTGFSSFFFSSDWKPINGRYGILSLFTSTMLVTLFSTLLGGAIGLFAAIALFRFVPKAFKKPCSFAISVLSGIPSVIYGLFGIDFIVPFIRDYVATDGSGYGIAAATAVLSIMILPTMVSFTLDALNAVDRSYYEGALSLGASREMALMKVVVPAARSGIFAALVLSSGRAMGETMAVIMVIGNRPNLTIDPFQSTLTLTGAIALGATEYSDDAKTSLIAVGAVLFALTFIVNLVFAIVKGRDKKC